MNYKGRINRVMPTVTGTKQDGGQWRRQDFIFEFFEQASDMWSSKVALSILGDRIDEYQLKEGMPVEISFSLSTTEYNGRIYTNARLHSFLKIEND